MTMIVIALALGLGTWLAIGYGVRLANEQKMLLGATVMVGVAGYLVVGSPGMQGAPVHNPEALGFGEPLEDPRMGMANRTGPATQWLSMSDGFMRANKPYLAAETLAEAVRRYPRNVDLWVAYGNALVAHSGGITTPASATAFDRAGAIDPSHPAPAFFAGLALAQGGDVEGARFVWTQLLNRSPADAPWREDLTQRLASLPPPPAAGAAPSAAADSAQGNAQGSVRDGAQTPANGQESAQ